MLFSYPHPQRHTFHREKEHPLHCLPKLTQHFSHNSFVTVMKQLWISAGLHRYHLSNGTLVQKTKRFKVFFFPIYFLSKFLQTVVVGVCVRVCLFALCVICICASRCIHEFKYLDLLGLILSVQPDRSARRAQN